MGERNTFYMKIAIIGASSALAHEAAKLFARNGAELFLVGRTPEKLEVVASDLKVRGARRVETYLLDLSDLSQHQEMLDQALATLGELDMLLIAHGTLGDQRKCERSVEETLKELHNNCISVISLLTLSANYFEQRRHGCIAVISSVAGDRGLKRNYVYGTAKAALTTFLQGLRGRLSSSNVAVVTIKPGFTATPMTAHMKRRLLTANAQAVGQGIYQAMMKKKDVVYLPWFWQPIMFVIRSIPESLYKRL
jgi:decaprenylphospho-beta-D-erythro-pentofuranosid-2-ulose 2-reductase